MQIENAWQNWSYCLLVLTILKIILANNTHRVHTSCSVVHVGLERDEQRIHMKLYFTLMRTEWKCMNLHIWGKISVMKTYCSWLFEQNRLKGLHSVVVFLAHWSSELVSISVAQKRHAIIFAICFSCFECWAGQSSSAWWEVPLKENNLCQNYNL